MKRYYYLTGKLLAVLITAIMMYETADAGTLIIRILVFGCLFAFQMLICTINRGKYQKWSGLCTVVALGYSFYLGFEDLFLIGLLIIIEGIDTYVKGNAFYEIEASVFLLLWFIYKPNIMTLLFTGVLTIMLLIIRSIVDSKEELRKINIEQKDKLAQMEKKLVDMKEYSKAIETSAVMEERNRFASRIHDQLGHNISGSIILLEATALAMDKDLENAKKNIRIVTENLRNGVDDIRTALKQERPSRVRMSLSEIKKELDSFQLTYGKEAVLETEGDMNKISMPVWICISDNLKEILTNMLKHSNGDRFRVRIACLNKVIRVEYKDNGSCMGEIKVGMGLSAIEDRTASVGGTTMIDGGPEGFQIITIFYL